MDEEEFRVGDVVRLRSGGPLMTVNSTEEDSTVGTNWFNTGLELQWDAFSTNMLEHYELCCKDCQ
jgi:uncharacterized protein YodC (DUF2158 family)